MSLGLIDTQTVSERPTTASATAVERAPFWWTSRGEPLFGWLHTGRGIARSDHAVVIAAPVGFEQLHAHRSLRHLADDLARLGIPTFRFDWHGAGDSTGIDEDGDRLETWRANLRDAVALLKDRLSISQVSVIGVRLGAALATTAFSAGEIAHLVLWAPVISGKTYVREMTAIDRTSEIPAPPAGDRPADLEPAGFTLTQQTAQDIAKINLLLTPPPARRVLIVSRDDLPGDARLTAAWTAAKICVEEVVVPGFAEMMAAPHKSDVPREAIRWMTQWLQQQQSFFSTALGKKVAEGRTLEFSLQAARHRLKPELQRDPPLPRSGGEGTIIQTAEGGQRTAIREGTVNLSHNPDLFGILSEPLAEIPPERPTIVLLNAGAAYRIGPGRLHVHLARRLAAEGFRCLRLDTSGFGDSVDESCENQVYDAAVFRDVDLTLQSLREQQLGRKFVVVGLCSGAYNAFQSAVSLSDPSLIGSVLINPLTFYWRDGMEISESTDRQLLVEQWYFASACDPKKWLKLLSGRSKIGLGGAIRLVVRRLGLTRRRTARDSADVVERRVYSHPALDDLPADLEQVVRRNRQLAMFFSVGDPGHAILMGKAGRTARRLQKQGRLHVEFIENADHNFSRRAARRALIDKLAAYLRDFRAGGVSPLIQLSTTSHAQPGG